MQGPGRGQLEIGVSKESGVPVRAQLFAQFALLIGTRRLKPGGELPGVRALARRLGVHYNTVSQAYRDLASAGFVTGRRGGRLTVRSPEEPLNAGPGKDLDDLINDAITLAREQGFTLEQLCRRVRERLIEEPPARVLAVSEEAAMRDLLRTELAGAFPCPVDACSAAAIAADPRLAAGAVVLAPPATLPDLLALLPKSHPAVPILYSDAGEQIEVVRRADRPSVVAVVSISPFFIEIARGVLSPVIANRHSLAEFLLPRDGACPAGAADIVFCDSVAYARLRRCPHRHTVTPYRLLAKPCLERIASALAGPGASAGLDTPARSMQS